MMFGYGFALPLLAAARLGPPAAVDVTAAALRAAMDDPASWGSGGWRVPGTAGARFSNAARASLAWAQQQDGSWRPVRHNMIRNGVLAGAAPGTPGTTPSATGLPTNPDGLQRSIVGVGLDPATGWPCLDINWAGTSGTAGTTTLFNPELNMQIAAIVGQRYTLTGWFALVGGTLANVAQLTYGIRFNNSAGTTVTAQNVSLLATVDATLRQYTTSLTATDGATAFVNGQLIANFVDSQPVNFTLRIAFPELYLGDYRLGVMPTSGTALYGPAIDWRADIGDWVIRHEPQATNQLVNSAWAGAVSGAPGTPPTNWNMGFGTGVTTTPAPSALFAAGGANATTFSGLAGTRGWWQQAVNVVAGETYALSAFVESVTGNPGRALFVANGTATVSVVSGSVDATTPGRYTLTFLASTSGTANIRVGAGTSNVTPTDYSISIAAPQVEVGTRASSPILSYGNTSATRAIDTPSGTYTGTAEGAIIVEGAPFEASSAAVRALAAIDDGTTSNRVALRLAASGGAGGRGEMVVTTGSVEQALVGEAGTPGAVPIRLSGTWAANQFRAYRDGVEIGTADTLGAVPATTTFRLGHTAGGSNSLNGYVRRLRIADTRTPRGL